MDWAHPLLAEACLILQTLGARPVYPVPHWPRHNSNVRL